MNFLKVYLPPPPQPKQLTTTPESKILKLYLEKNVITSYYIHLNFTIFMAEYIGLNIFNKFAENFAHLKVSLSSYNDVNIENIEKNYFGSTIYTPPI